MLNLDTLFRKSFSWAWVFFSLFSRWFHSTLALFSIRVCDALLWKYLHGLSVMPADIIVAVVIIRRRAPKMPNRRPKRRNVNLVGCERFDSRARKNHEPRPFIFISNGERAAAAQQMRYYAKDITNLCTYGVKNLLSVMNSHERGGREKWENYHREEANDRQRFIHYFKYDRRKDIPEQRKLSHLSPYYRLIDCWEISLMSLRMKTKSQQCVRESEMLSHFVGL